MSLPNFKTQIKNIRKEMLQLGYSENTINQYFRIWNNYIRWKNINNFNYNDAEYNYFLLECYNFDINTDSNKLKSYQKQLIRSKKILNNFDEYKINMSRKVLPSKIYNNYPKNWDEIMESYINYCENVRINSANTIYQKRKYLIRLLSFFYKNNIEKLEELTKEDIIKFINQTINKGEVSKRRNFYVLRDFLNFLFIESIQNIDLSIYVPKTTKYRRKKIPTYLKQNEIQTLLDSIDKTRKIDKRNYTIILIAARLGLRISDILNIRFKDIEWENYKLNIIQPKTNNRNILPLTKEIGWAIIDYIKTARPITNNEYLFVKHKYPYEKMNNFNSFNKYFEKSNIAIENENKKGIHNLRHSLATNMLDNDIPLDIISSILGHSNLNTTNTYLSINLKKLSECVLEVDE